MRNSGNLRTEPISEQAKAGRGGPGGGKSQHGWTGRGRKGLQAAGMCGLQFGLQCCSYCVQPYGPGVRGLTVEHRCPHRTAAGANRDIHTGKLSRHFPESVLRKGLGSGTSGLTRPGDPDIRRHN